MKLKFLLILLLSFQSCKYAIIVPKKNIIFNQKGYLLFCYDQSEALFFNWKDTLDRDFLLNDHLNGYRIGDGEKDLDYLKKLSATDSVTYSFLHNEGYREVNTNIKLIPVNVQYYWGDNSKLRLQKELDNKVSIKFEYKKEKVNLSYTLYDHRIIMSITPVRKSDINRIASL